MTPRRLLVNPVPLSILAAGLLAWAGVLIIIAVVGRDRIVPDFFDELRAEHFLAFYLIAFLSAVSLPTMRLRTLMLLMVALASGVEFARGSLGQDWTRVQWDWVCNVAGAFLALAPIYLATVRDAFVADTEET